MKDTDRELLSVRIECWDRRGLNLGYYSVSKPYDSLSEAIEDGRMLWKWFSMMHDKQISISDREGNRIWQYLNGKIWELNEHGKLECKK